METHDTIHRYHEHYFDPQGKYNNMTTAVQHYNCERCGLPYNEHGLPLNMKPEQRVGCSGKKEKSKWFIPMKTKDNTPKKPDYPAKRRKT